MHFFQLWVNLPAANKYAPPADKHSSDASIQLRP